jgi:DNA-binding CsgD family transcriptional regulator
MVKQQPVSLEPEQIEILLAKYNKSQKELAAGIAVNQATVSNYMKGQYGTAKRVGLRAYWYFKRLGE